MIPNLKNVMIILNKYEEAHYNKSLKKTLNIVKNNNL